MATRDTATRLRVSYVTNMGETRNPENPEPMTAAERMRRHRARQLGDDVPKAKPGPKPRKPQTLREASLEELIDEVSDRLTGRMADDREIRDLALRGVVHSYQTSGDRLSFVSIEPFAEGLTNLGGARNLTGPLWAIGALPGPTYPGARRGQP